MLVNAHSLSGTCLSCKRMKPGLTAAVCMMQMGSFEMRVRRSVKGGASSLSASSSNGSEPAYPTPAPGMAKHSSP